jgi:hypothetical protein
MKQGRNKGRSQFRATFAAALLLGAGACLDPGALGIGDAASSGVDGGGQPGTDAGSGIDPTTLPRFSFFVTSLRSLQELSGSEVGFGGDLSYGESGPGAGLRGADRLCAEIAEKSLEGASGKQWRAFLSAVDDGTGYQVDAIDRIGGGPWYDRLERLFANDLSELLNTRPVSADATIINDFPNEYGVLNHDPDLDGEVDNHDTLTGSDATGRLYGSTSTCQDWTTADGSYGNGRPRVGHSWPTEGGPGGGGPGGGGPGGQDMANWMSALDEAGCAAGINLIQTGGAPPGSDSVGAGGGYGGFYCFALMP